MSLVCTKDVDRLNEFEQFKELFMSEKKECLKKKKYFVISATWWRAWCDFNNIPTQKPSEVFNSFYEEIKFKPIDL